MVMAVADANSKTDRKSTYTRKRSTPTKTPDTGGTAVAEQTEPLAWQVKLYLFAVMMPIGFYAASIYMTPLRLTLLIMIVPLVVKLLKGDYGRLIITDILFLAFISWAAVAWSMHHGASVFQHIGSSGIEFLGGYMIARAYIRSRAQFIALCKMLGILIAITLPLTLYESQTDRPLLIDLARSLPGIRAPDVIYHEPRLGMFRSQVVFAHPILYGAFCSLGFMLTFGALKGQISNKRRYLVSAMVGLCTFMSLSSGAILAVAIQIALFSWYWAFRKIEWRWLLFLGLVACAYILVDVMSTRTPVRVFMSYAAFSAHNAFWRGVINEWGLINIFGSVEHGVAPSPWIGIGGNDWVRPGWMFSASVDNFWLLTAMTYGVPGFVFLVGGYALALWKIGRRNFRGDAALEAMRRSWVITFMGLTFTLITVHVWTALYSFVFFMFGAGMWMYRAEPVVSEPEAETEDDTKDDTAPSSPYTRFPASDVAATRPQANQPSRYKKTGARSPA